jgi:uncharacterized protein YacL
MEDNKYIGKLNPAGQFEFEQKRSSILGKSLIVAGIGFLFIFLFGFIMQQVLMNMIYKDQTSLAENTLTTLLVVSLVLIIVSMIMSMFMFRKIETASKISIILMIAFYSIAQGVGFGLLFFDAAYSN